MKILVLSYPYHGAYSLCESIAQTLEYKFLDDPMNLHYHGATRYVREDLETGQISRKLDTNPRSYIYPNIIPDDSITLHYVKMNKLPQNFEEDQFLGSWVGQFDKVISIRSNNLETNWKRWCAAKSTVKENNAEWEWWASMQCDFIEYKDSHYDQTCVDKITLADSFLQSYENSNNNIIKTTIQTIQKQSAAENNIHPDIINSELSKWDIGIGYIGFRNNKWENLRIYDNLNAWTNRY